MSYQIHIENITTFVNERNLPTFDISRTGGSPLGNPEYVPKDVTPEAREAAIGRYKQWLWGEMAHPVETVDQMGQKVRKVNYRGPQLNELGRLARASERGEIVLLCYCKEQGREVACHGDVVKIGIKWYLEKFRHLTPEESEWEGEEVEKPEVNQVKARTVHDLVTPKQLWLIRKLANEKKVSLVDAFEVPMDCPLEEMNKRAASGIIERLKGMEAE